MYMRNGREGKVKEMFLVMRRGVLSRSIKVLIYKQKTSSLNTVIDKEEPNVRECYFEN